MKNILEYLENWTNEEKIAVIEEDKKISYRNLIEVSKKIGSGLVKFVSPRNPVPVLMNKGIDCLTVFFGTVYAGNFYVLLNPELPAARLEKILNVLEPTVIVTDKEHLELANGLSKGQKILDIENLKNSNIDEKKLEEIRNQALDVDPLYANFTSGSTGEPKGVLVGHRSVLDFINIFTDKFDITGNDIIANQAPFDFDVSVKDIYSSIKMGATLLIVPRKMFSKPTELLDYICDNKATTLIWAVSALCLVTTFHALDYRLPETINKILFSGEVMPLKHLKQWMEKLPNVTFVNLYGPTEITCNCTYHILEKGKEYEKIPMGKPFDNEQVFLLDENNQLIEEKNKTGEICVKGTALALGYYNSKEQTDKSFVQNPLNTKYLDMIYKTGDLGYLGNDNNFYFSGRKDFQIKHMGHRIELEEIEKEMEKVNEVVRACCIYDQEKSKIYAFYMGNIEKNDLHGLLKNNLPVFMVPNILRQMEEFPITKNGKIDRKALMTMQKEGK